MKKSQDQAVPPERLARRKDDAAPSRTERGDPPTTAFLPRLILEDPSSDVRVRAGLLLARMGCDPSLAADAILAYLMDPSADPVAKEQYLEDLGTLAAPSSKVVPALLREARTSVRQFRATASRLPCAT